MSGYLEVKYPSKQNLGLNPFKSWKKQWCILRPSPTCSGAALAVYCSEAGAPAGTVNFPVGCLVDRAKSRTRPHAFAVFTLEEPHKPRVLLAASSAQDAQVWMDKIKALVNNNTLLGTEALLKDTYSVTVVTTDLSRKCGLNEVDSLLTVSSKGIFISRCQKLGTFIQWKYISEAALSSENSDINRTCILAINNEFNRGGGELRLSSPTAGALVEALQGCIPRRNARCSSEGDLRTRRNDEEVRRSSWHSRPSEVSLDDVNIAISKGCTQLSAPLSRRVPTLAERLNYNSPMCDRRSLASVASGIYEEIPDEPVPSDNCKNSHKSNNSDKSHNSANTKRSQNSNNSDNSDLYCKMSQHFPKGVLQCPVEEPAYESVSECVYATLRRVSRRPPPLPPRQLVPGNAGAVTRHGSLGALVSRTNKPDKRQPFSVFRKRLKSDSRIATSPKSETPKDKDVETKKKKFDFTPTRDIFKNFRVSRKMKNLKIATGLTKGETKSCEFLDETEHVTTSRCSKSVECLEDNEFLDEFDGNLSLDYNDDALTALNLPKELVELILEHENLNKVRLKAEESEYMPMSPLVPVGGTTIDHHYIVMSPRTNSA